MATTKFKMEMLDKPCSELDVTVSELESIVASAKEVIGNLNSKGKLTAEEQEQRTDILDFIQEAEGRIKALVKEQAAAGYIVQPGSEKNVHLRLRHGKRFDSSTGKEISPEFNQVFSYSEWRLFKAHHISLGYKIIKVLFDPYGEAKED